MSKEIRDIQFRAFYPDHHEENDYIKQRLDKAMLQIKKVVEKKKCSGCGFPKLMCDGYNQAISDIAKLFEV